MLIYIFRAYIFCSLYTSWKNNTEIKAEISNIENSIDWTVTQFPQFRDSNRNGVTERIIEYRQKI